MTLTRPTFADGKRYGLMVLGVIVALATGTLLFDGHLAIGVVALVAEVILLATRLRLEQNRQSALENEVRAKENERIAHSLFMNSPVAKLVVDHQSEKIRAANNAAVSLYGFTRDELLMMTLPSLSAAGDRHRRKGGELFDVQITSQALSYRGDAASILAIQDVTEQHRLEAQLRHSQKMEAIGRLAGGVAHDFNNMLSIILGFTMMLLEEPQPDETREPLEEIQRAAERSAELARQLLVFSRQTATPEATAPIDITASVTDQRKSLERILGDDVVLDVHVPLVSLWTKIDRVQLEQVVKNLVVNARDAMPNGGKLTIRLEREEHDKHIVLRVTDTGHGMDDSTKARVFDPFFTTKEEGKGTGLGLAIVFGIVQRFGGHMNVDSVIGRGTTFEVRLDEVVPAERESGVTSKTQPGTMCVETILLVEDEAPVRRVMDRALRRTGYNVISTAHPHEAIELAANPATKIDLLVTDVCMPKMSGPKLVERLLKDRPDLKVLFVSGFNDTVFDEPLRESAFFLQKPVALNVLSHTVRTIMNGNIADLAANGE